MDWFDGEAQGGRATSPRCPAAPGQIIDKRAWREGWREGYTEKMNWPKPPKPVSKPTKPKR